MVLDVLLRVAKGGAYAAAALEGELGRSELERRDRALATELLFGVLRWQGALDLRIEPLLKNRVLGELDAVVLSSLRLGAYQLVGPSRVPTHAAVAETVGLVRSRRGKGPAGLANAVLRRLAREVDEVDERGEGGEGEGAALNAADAMPTWLMAELEASHGREAALAVAQDAVRQPWTGLRLEGEAGGSKEELVEQLRRAAPAADVQAGALSALGTRALRARGLGPVAELEAYREGAISVQDEGAQACTLLLDIEPGQRVLDACAGRGGKTTLLAAMAAGQAEIDAADRHPGKLKRIAPDLERLGLGGVRTVAVDLGLGHGGLTPPYDRILLDAPCSGTGTLARRPEIRWRLGPEDVTRLATVQARLLDRCLELLGPRGALVYCVCSILDAEGAAQIRRVLDAGEHPGLTTTRELLLLPHEHETDGFYAARLERRPE